MKTPFAIRKIEEWSYDYIKMECEEGKCYGVLAVRLIVLAPGHPLSYTLSRFIEFALHYSSSIPY